MFRRESNLDSCDCVVRPAALLKRSLIFVHRWIGVALSVIFLLWFASGIVMMYWSFPDVTRRAASRTASGSQSRSDQGVPGSRARSARN